MSKSLFHRLANLARPAERVEAPSATRQPQKAESVKPSMNARKAQKQGAHLAEKARRYAEAGDAALAIEQFELAIGATKGKAANLRTELGKQLLKVGRYRDALAAFEAVLAARPDSLSALRGAANAAHQDGDFEKAAPLWRTLRDASPDAYSPENQRRHASALLRLGEADEAERIFADLRERDPESPNGLIGLARVAERAEDWDKAIILLKQVLEDFPQRKAVAESLRRCEEAAALGAPLSPRDLSEAQSREAEDYLALTRRTAAADPAASANLRFKSVFIVTYGRSGSTLLQGVLNTIDGVLVRGENKNYFFKLFEAHEALVIEKRGKRKPHAPNNPWYGIEKIDLSALLKSYSAIARDVVLADRASDEGIKCYGFKEVRYNKTGEKLADYLTFLSLIFPEPAFIFLTRNLDDVVSSAWWAERDPEEVRQMLTETEARFENYAKDRPNCFSLTYDDLVSKSEKLRGMFDFLGAPYEAEVLDIILATPHSYMPKLESVQEKFRNF